ncbi:GNAT family N-acetyltransferase [Micromonosporaceae bacterium Da 78-11]
MEITEFHGLSIARITPGDLSDRPWASSREHIDVVRLPDPPAGAWTELAEAGFIRKPAWLSWIAELRDDEGDFLSRLDAKARQDIRRAHKRAEQDLELVVHDRLDAATVDRFLELYRHQVADMTYGVAIACQQRDRLLSGDEKYFGVFALQAGEMVGGCLVLECPDQEAVRIRFSAVTDRWRRDSLARTLYFAAMRTARTKGYRWATLGDEPNLYGHLTKAGLFPFKVKMGFHCVPAQDFHDKSAADEADLVLRLDHLCDPCLILGYDPDSTTGRELMAHVIADPPADLRRYAAPFLSGVHERPLGQGVSCLV